jgi:hypothetical protein
MSKGAAHRRKNRRGGRTTAQRPATSQPVAKRAGATHPLEAHAAPTPALAARSLQAGFTPTKRLRRATASNHTKRNLHGWGDNVRGGGPKV